MKRLIYGYLRLTDDLDDKAIRQMERGLRGLAEAEGFCLATTFCESQNGYHGAFSELTEELKRAAAHDVVTPSLDHISHHPIVRDHLLTRLEHDADARVWVVERSATRTSRPRKR